MQHKVRTCAQRTCEHAVVTSADTTGPKEAAYVVNELIRPAAVIASHANEQATRDGKLIAG